MPVETTPLGPGSLTITPPAGTALDLSCQVESGVVHVDKSKSDDVVMLCGDVRVGPTTYSSTLTVTIAQDLGNPDGVVFFSWDHRGEVCGFVYTPNTDAGATVTGDLVMDPLDVGGDTGGEDMTSDATWDCVGIPDLAPGTVTATSVAA
jgi:hypothetical protein